MFSIDDGVKVINILIIDDNYEVYTLLKDLFFEDIYYNLIYASSDDYKDNDFSNISLIVLNIDNQNNTFYEFINNNHLKQLSTFIPIIVMSNNNSVFFQRNIIKHLGFFIHKSYSDEYIYELIKRIANLFNLNKFSNSLSGIPSSISINNELITRIDSEESFSFMYIDLDKFKSFNDDYGYLKGNEVIIGLANIIFEVIDVYGDENDFIGHIGGDDFVAIVNSENDEIIAKNIIKSFDNFSKKIYDPGESFLKIINNISPDGVEKMEFMSVSIAIVTNKSNSVSKNEFLENIVKSKKKAKSIEGSSLFKIEL